MHATTGAGESKPSRWKLGVSLWIAGTVGVLLAVFVGMPAFMAQHPPHHALKFPMWVVLVGACIQTSLWLAAFVGCGVLLASRVGLRAPAFEAFSSGGPVGAALVPQLLPGLVGGLLTAAVPWYFTSHGLIIELHTPSALAMAVFYGGIDEEIMMRWGLMTFLVWVGWRMAGRRTGGPSGVVLWTGIIISAVLFGAGHLPSTYLLNGHLTGSMVGSVIVGGAAFGVIAGYLYHRWGLEAAMICHALSHVFAYAAYKIV